MAALTKNAILVTVRDRAKRTKILDHKGQITNIFKIFIKKTSKLVFFNLFILFLSGFVS